MMNRKRLLSLLLAVALVFTLAAPAAAETHDHNPGLTPVDDSLIQEPLSAGQIADITPEEPEYAEDEILRVSIFLKKKGTLDAGYSPVGIASNHAALNYNQTLKQDQVTMEQKISSAIGQELDVVWNLTLATNLISANVEYGQIEIIEAIPGVEAVVIETRYDPAVVDRGNADPNMATSGTQTGSYNAWAAGYTGAGTRIAIIDTGLDVEHEAFHSGAFLHALNVLAEDQGQDAAAYISGLDLLDAAEINKVLTNLNVYSRIYGNGNVRGADLFVSDKIPFGYNYVDGNLDLSHFDSEHGSHVAGISAANTYVYRAGAYEDALSETGVRGVASDAQLLVMKVFGEAGGAYDSDIIAAIEDAVLLDCDAVNLSLGSSVPGTSMINSDYPEQTQRYQNIMDRLINSGVVVSISAGNNSYWADNSYSGFPYADDVSFHTGGSPGTYTNSLCVASADNNLYNTPSHMSVGGYDLPYTETQGYGNARMTSIAGTYQYVYVNTIGTEADFAALGREMLEGKIVLCNRGTTSFAEKANAAAAMGAAGVIIVNTDNENISLVLDGYAYTVPVVAMPMSHGQVFQYYGDGHYVNNTTIPYYTGIVTVSENVSYSMSSFSSWGVPSSLKLKPEITAPGGQIWSVAGEVYNAYYQISGHESYEYMSGTSMAAPQVAGMAAVLAQYIKENGLDVQTGVAVRTLAQSLLMSTALPLTDMYNEHLYYPVIQQGAGLGDVGQAIMADSYILMGSDATDSWDDGKVKAELGDDPDQTGVYSFSFTIHNLTDMDKTFVLSGDFFTQALLADNELLDTWTRPLNPELTWTVNGQTVENGAALAGMDFDGNGAVNAADGQALLDYAAGVRTELTNAHKADLDADGTVDTYDSYLFFLLLERNGALVPANGAATVTVTVTLTEHDRAILADYPNGAYIEGYVFAKSLATKEGRAGTSHSIPVLGFYGDWSDPSMFDKGSFQEYQHGTEDRMPYLYDENYMNGNYNGLVYYDAANDANYWFGGNPAIQDTVYMPERNAFNPNSGDEITTLGFALIRNACGAWYFVRNTDTGEYLEYEDIAGGSVYPAFYYPGTGSWQNTFYTADNLGFTGAGLADGTHLEIGVIAPPEYCVDAEGNVDWDALGKGAEFSMPLIIDTKDPWIMGWTVDEAAKTMTVSAYDNQYVAAVALYNSNGKYLTGIGSNPDAEMGQTLSFELDISQVGGANFLLAVYDYAGNVAAYTINEQIGEIVEWVDSVTVEPERLTLMQGDTAKLSAAVYPLNTLYPEVEWYSANEDVVTVDQSGNILAVGVGGAYVYAASTYDSGISDYCYVEVVEAGNGMLNAIIWDANAEVIYSSFDVNDPAYYVELSGDLYDKTYGVMNAACVGSDGTLYVSSTDPEYGEGCLYTMDPNTFEVNYLNDCVVQGWSIFYTDMTFAPAMFGTGAILATYGPYVIAVDPATGEAIGIIDGFEDFGSSIVGITTVESYYYYASSGGVYVYEDVVLLTFADGTIIEECYYGYSDMVVPYNDYFEGTRYGMDTDIDLGDTWYYNSAYYDGNYLYWAAIDVDNHTRVTLYAIDYYGTGKVYEKGKFNNGVWPVAGLHEKGVRPQISDVASVHMEEQYQALDPERLEAYKIELQPVSGEYLTKKQAVMSGSGSTAAPMSEIRDDEGNIVVELTAADANGSAVDSNNGLFTVTYDPEEMTLVEIEVHSQYSACKDLDGTITIGYVDLNGIPADEVVVTLKFQSNNSNAKIDVIHHEVNDQNPGWQETLTLGCIHENLTYASELAPGCETAGREEHWFCPSCGKYFLDAECTREIAAEDVEIPATGHTWGDWVTVEAPTEDAFGRKERTCSACGQTETDTIPPTGTIYGDCNGDGKVNGKDLILLRQYLADWDVEPVMNNSDCNGDGKINGKDLILLRQYLADWDVTLGPEPEEEPHSILGTWVYVTREDWEGDNVALVDINYMKFNADGTGWDWFENWSNYDLLYGRPADGWVDITPPYSDNSFTYTLEGDQLTVTYAPIEDFEVEAETEVYTLVWNEDGSLTIHYPDGDERTYKLLPRDNMSLEELMELFGIDSDLPLPEDPSWIEGYWTNVTREDYYDEDLGAWRANVVENDYTFNTGGTGTTGGYEWTNWDFENGCPGDHWEIAPMGYEWPSFTYTLEGDRLTINAEHYDMTGDEPDLIIHTDVYIVTKNADGSITLTHEDSGYSRVYRRVEEDTTLEGKLELFGLDPSVPEN